MTNLETPIAWQRALRLLTRSEHGRLFYLFLDVNARRDSNPPPCAILGVLDLVSKVSEDREGT